MVAAGKALVPYNQVAVESKMVPDTNSPMPTRHSKKARSVMRRRSNGDEPSRPATIASITTA
jgi:hypothetical protein